MVGHSNVVRAVSDRFSASGPRHRANFSAVAQAGNGAARESLRRDYPNKGMNHSRAATLQARELQDETLPAVRQRAPEPARNSSLRAAFAGGAKGIGLL
jgi:hypothetical protein